jgi:pimeloyl-ACP methyl ester carboxylesterase
MQSLSAEERRTRTSPGVELAYHVIGARPEDGAPAILLANGLGGSWRAWSHQLRQMQDRFRFVSWDYRGLYASPRPPSLERLDPRAQAEDGLAVLDEERIDGAIVIGWSMGVQVALEIARLAPARVRALVLINGVAGRPWDTLGGGPLLGRLAPHALRAARTVPDLLHAGTMKAVSWPGTPRWIQRLGLASRTIDLDLFHTLAGSFGDLDMEVYVETLRQLGEHDAHDVLDGISMPTLLVAGSKDLMTPRASFERIAQRVPHAELLVVPGGTHYLAIEYPEVVNLRIERFLRQHDLGPRDARRSVTP